jgi:NAD(P)-dependent dehydrogenase (short-subunit alcohol dehydrogenase family)
VLHLSAHSDRALVDAIEQRFRLAHITCNWVIAPAEIHSVVPDVWINICPGLAPRKANSLSESDWACALQDTVVFAARGARMASKHMIGRRSGIIINIASALGEMAEEDRALESVVGAGISALTRSLGVEWGPAGVRVVGIALPPADVRNIRLPLRRAPSLQDVADAAYFLASADASYLTAETIRVDAGWGAYQLF